MVSDLASSGPSDNTLLRVRGLSKRYLRGALWQRRVSVIAASEVDFEIPAGQTLALV